MELLLPPAKQRWAACALMVGNIVLIGDREGSFYLYPAYGEVLISLMLIKRFSRIHRNLFISPRPLHCDPFLTFMERTVSQTFN